MKAPFLGRTGHSVCFARGNHTNLANLTTLSSTASANDGLRIVTWLILPVVICLSQRLSHACLSINGIQWNCEWLIKTVIVYLVIEFTWITVVILELIHAVKPDSSEGPYLLDNRPSPPKEMWWIIVTNRIAWALPATNHSSFCPISFRW